MRRLIIAGLAAATVASAANAQETCQERRENRTAGTVAGAGIGAILGGVIGGNGLGVALGAVSGGVAGNQLARGPEDCIHAYGYYDNGGRWHGNRVEAGVATGFYDRDGRWVPGAPAGYYDRDGRWVPTEAHRGYYDRNGYWVAAGVPGYYADGRYVEAQPVAVPPPPPYPPVQGAYGDPRNGQYAEQRPYRSDWYGDVDRYDIRGRIARTGERIDRSLRDGTLTYDQARHARFDLSRVDRLQNSMPHYNGRLSPTDYATIDARLDEINGRIRASRDQARTDYPR